MILSGWAIDEAKGALAADVFVLVDGQLIAPTDYERHRPDVADHFDNEALSHSGWSANLELENLPPGKHKLNLRIISRDGQRCYEPRRGVRIYLHD